MTAIPTRINAAPSSKLLFEAKEHCEDAVYMIHGFDENSAYILTSRFIGYLDVKIPMPRITDIISTASAPVVWGTTYYVTTEFLPDGYPMTVAMLRALPAGLLLFLFVRTLPDRRWWGRIILLGALNISVFLICLFIAAYRLPGGVAATVSATQPLMAIFLARILLDNPLRIESMLAASAGLGGVAVLVLSPETALDPIGLAAGFGGAASMATGNVLAKKWKSADASLLAFTSWQLIAGGVLLIPVAWLVEPPLPTLTYENIGGLIWLSVIGAALTYLVWFRGIARMDSAAVSALLFLSPATAVVVGWALLGQSLSTFQLLGVLVVLASVWCSQIADKRSARKHPARSTVRRVSK
jgi:probable blue pigment (indigoidine) exporter